MEILVYFVFIVAIIACIYASNDNNKKIKKYISDREGKFVSKKREYFDLKSVYNSTSYKLVYYDKNMVLRAVLIRQSFIGVEFSGDHEVHSQDRHYFEDDYVEEKVFETKPQKKTLHVDYTYKCGTDEITVKQEFYQPNKGESVFLNKVAAPNGKYKLGFMNYIHVENGKIKNLTMF